ncbi:hypothetical protein FSP39_017392 [Pinctada imbricata]|uniref:Cationic amino acid transporter C-terminal domain-containing protein n=1 Tax=Pinctada imbricata TaxID=66713 RepID=A0AA88YNX3_PINIB|nr:hypothetical protein FSP39_017392 [Pinctada imbricata]
MHLSLLHHGHLNTKKRNGHYTFSKVSLFCKSFICSLNKLGLCYSELTTRIPKSGSSYVYTYSTLGELCGFIAGWNMLIEHVIGASITAKAWSQYTDHLFNGTVHRYIYIQADNKGTKFDIKCLNCITSQCLIHSQLDNVTSAIAIILTTLSVFMTFCIICVGFFHVKHENWTDPPGFFPNGLQGTLCGTSLLFYVFASADRIACSSEETKDPTKVVPTGICFTLAMTSILLFCVSIAVTLCFPGNLFPESVALPIIFRNRGIEGADSLITIGGMVALFVACVCTMYSIARLLYGISSDGLLFHPFKLVNELTGTPIYSIIFAFLVSAVVMLSMSLELLILINSVSTLISSILVSICVICLRYQQDQIGLRQEYEEPSIDQAVLCTEFVYASFLADPKINNNETPMEGKEDKCCQQNSLMYGSMDQNNSFNRAPRGSTYRKMDSMINNTPNGSSSSLFPLPTNHTIDPTHATWMKVNSSLVAYTVASVILSLMIDLNLRQCCSYGPSWWRVTIIILSIVTLLVSFIIIARQPQNRAKLIFKTPYVPVVPLVSILFNAILLATIPYEAWVRFAVGLCTGIVIYISYGIRHSEERKIDEQEVILYEITEN